MLLGMAFLVPSAARANWTSLLDQCGFDVEDVRYDGLWDAPYFLPMPWPERFLLQLPSVLLFRYGAIRPGVLGENVWLWAKKR